MTTWETFRTSLYVNAALGVSLDLSRLGMPADFIAKHSEKTTRAFKSMEDLERGSIANPDEERMVGHYWLRDASRAHDGRCLKLLGDGCLVAFEDPRRALAFVDDVHGLGAFRVGVALGLVEDLGGELGGRTVMHAHELMRGAGAGETRCCPVTQAVCGRSQHHPPPRVVGGVH